MQRKHRETKLLRILKLCQEGIERVQRVHKKNSISSSEIRGVSKREDT
jgi:hypothetical protein